MQSHPSLVTGEISASVPSWYNTLLNTTLSARVTPLNRHLACYLRAPGLLVDPNPKLELHFLNEKLVPRKKHFPYLKTIALRATTQVAPPASERPPSSHSSVPTHGPAATTSSFFLPILSH